MFGTQIDDSVTVTTPSEADLVVTKVKIHRFQIDPEWPPVGPPGVSKFKSVDSLCSKD